MKPKKLYTQSIPNVSHDFAMHLDKVFPAIKIKPGVSQDELQANGGERKVVEYILRVASGTSISGDVSDIRPTPNSQSLLSRLLGNRQ